EGDIGDGERETTARGEGFAGNYGGLVVSAGCSSGGIPTMVTRVESEGFRSAVREKRVAPLLVSPEIMVVEGSDDEGQRERSCSGEVKTMRDPAILLRRRKCGLSPEKMGRRERGWSGGSDGEEIGKTKGWWFLVVWRFSASGVAGRRGEREKREGRQLFGRKEGK
ncbi:hypothetical protein HAX54_004969, partial [Datura stramonium]|nr:hypothetical protein [Datura stramonium]